MKKIIFTTMVTAVLLVGLSACGGNKKTVEKTSNTTTSEIISETTESSEVKKTVSFDEINKGKEPEDIYKKFIKTVESGENGTAESLVVVLYKPECPECQEVENYIAYNIVDSEKVASSISYVDGFSYNAVAVDITEKVPDWVQNIYGIADENNNYNTPTVVVETLKKSSDGKMYWETFDRATGTNKDAISNVLDFYIRQDYVSFLEVAPTEDDRFLLKN